MRPLREEGTANKRREPRTGSWIPAHGQKDQACQISTGGRRGVGGDKWAWSRGHSVVALKRARNFKEIMVHRVRHSREVWQNFYVKASRWCHHEALMASKKVVIVEPWNRNLTTRYLDAHEEQFRCLSQDVWWWRKRRERREFYFAFKSGGHHILFWIGCYVQKWCTKIGTA